MRFVFMVVAAIFCLTSGAWGQDSSPESLAVYIEQLGVDDYELRQQAEDELRKLGSIARPLLEVAATSTDPEISLRAHRLLQNLLVDELWDGSRVSINMECQPVSLVLGELAKHTGNLFVMDKSESDFHDVPVSVTATSAPFWEVVDEICRQSGNRVRVHYGGLGEIVVVKGEFNVPISYAGPLRVHLENARRMFTEELDYEEERSTINGTFEINFQLMWESRFRLVAYRSTPFVVEAVTDTDVSVIAIPPALGSWTMTSSGNSRGMKLAFQPPPASASLFKKLHLRWEFMAIGDMAAIDIVDLSASTHYQDDVELELEDINKMPDGRYEVTVTVSRDFSLPEPSNVILIEHDLKLFDDAGNLFDQVSRSNTMTDRGVVTKVSYAGARDNRRPARLRFTYPRIRSQRKVDFLLRDIPLPHAVPK